jgi:hypothetical protein
MFEINKNKKKDNSH